MAPHVSLSNAEYYHLCPHLPTLVGNRIADTPQILLFTLRTLLPESAYVPNLSPKLTNYCFTKNIIFALSRKFRTDPL
jgi:hypothetical protein